MKSVIALTLLGMAAATPDALLQPSQTFFLPLPEEDMMAKSFESINSVADGSVKTLMSMSVSTDNTIIYYDHWEDGFELDVTNASSSTTEIWGDGNAANGCAPNVADCTDAKDVLMAGNVIVIENDVPVRPRGTSIRYDGGDRVMTNLPIAVVKASYPQRPGGVMAGAVEVFDTLSLGKGFIAPVGENLNTQFHGAFQYTALYIQAAEDDTVVTTPKGSFTIQMGETHVHWPCMQNDAIEASKPVQVDLITGDKASVYEMRWFALVPHERWAKEYFTPVGDSLGQTQAALYNPGPSKLEIKYEYLDANGNSVFGSKWVNPKQMVMSDTVPTGSGMMLYASEKFLPLSISDNSYSGQVYDWGFPILPKDMLSSQVLIGLGYGCVNNDCKSFGYHKEHSVVWISPVEDCNVYVDYENDGVVDDTYLVKRLEGKIIRDDDQDMSGAFIYATKVSDGSPCDIAGAWGQNTADADVSRSSALDLGTVVVPFYSTKVSKHVELVNDKDGSGDVTFGDEVKWTIKFSNVGPGDLPVGRLTIVDPALPDMTYVEGSAQYTDHLGVVTAISDDSSGTKFPLDGAGFKNPKVVPKRGGTHFITFNAIVNAGASSPLVNTGVLKQPYSMDLPFEASVPVNVDWVPPTKSPTRAPTRAPTDKPTKAPTKAPTAKPTSKPTKAPTESPTAQPTEPALVTLASTNPSCPIDYQIKILPIVDYKTVVPHNY